MLLTLLKRFVKITAYQDTISYRMGHCNASPKHQAKTKTNSHNFDILSVIEGGKPEHA